MDWTSETPFLVIVNYYDADVSWTQRLKFPHVVFHKDTPEKEPFNASNVAKSESNLLKFIGDFYDDLPENIIIVHQYEYKGSHKGSLVDILNDPLFKLKYEQSLTPGFWSFNIYVISSIMNELPVIKQSGWWDDCMFPYFGDIDGYGDFAAGKKGAAQFVVSRDRIRSLPRKFYTDIYDWYIENEIKEEPTGIDPKTSGRILSKNWNNPRSSFFTSRYLEWTWQLIFTAYRPTQDNSVIINNESISAIYGAGSYFYDVTTAVVKKFLQRDGSLLIPPLNLNDIFGDPIHGKQKTLIVKKGQMILSVGENNVIHVKTS